MGVLTTSGHLASCVASVVGCLGLALAVAGPAMAAPANSSQPPATAPFQFAPDPFALPSANAALHRQFTTLLKGFRAIQKSEVVLSGEAGKDLSAQIVVHLRPGMALDARALQSLACLLTGAAPGLAPSRLNIAASDGRMLVAGGVVQTATPPPGGSDPRTARLVALGLAIILLAAALPFVLRRRRREPDDPLEALLLHQGAALVALLRHERPELAGLLVAVLNPRAGRGLQRRLRAQHVPIRLPARPPDARVVAAAVRELQERLSPAA